MVQDTQITAVPGFVHRPEFQKLENNVSATVSVPFLRGG
jgi:hypothetical protein